MIAPLHNVDCLFLAKENPAKVGYATLAVVEPATLVEVAKAFLAAQYHLEDVSGLVTADGAVSTYHFSHFDTGDRATILAIAPLDTPSFPSIAAVYQGAEWHERETRDFFGFQYEGNPNFIPLLLAETMPDVHPLLKEEGQRAPLSAIFSAEGREREIVKKADSFTLLDVPVKEEAPAPEPVKEELKAAAPVEAPKEAPKAEAPAEEPKAEAPVEAPKPEVPAEEPKVEAPVAAPKVETPAEEPKVAAPVEEPKAEEPVKEPKVEAPNVEAPAEEPKVEAPVKEASKVEAAPEKPAKATVTVKKGKVVPGKSGKKGARK